MFYVGKKQTEWRCEEFKRWMGCFSGEWHNSDALSRGNFTFPVVRSLTFLYLKTGVVAL